MRTVTAGLRLSADHAQPPPQRVGEPVEVRTTISVIDGPRPSPIPRVPQPRWSRMGLLSFQPPISRGNGFLAATGGALSWMTSRSTPDRNGKSQNIDVPGCTCRAITPTETP